MCTKIKFSTICTIISLFIITVSLFSQQVDPMIPDLVAANSRFGFKLFNEIYNQNSNNNIFFSPLSISLALTMIYNGAAGETERAMAKTLELQGMSLEQINRANHKLLNTLLNLDKNVQLNLANSLWANKHVTFKEKFMRINKEFYGAEITSLDLNDIRSIQRINGWIKQKTKGKIENILDSGDIGAILFLINAIYFKADWTVGFSEDNTRERDFTLLDGSKKAVPMMMSQSSRYKYYQGEDFQAVELPYGNESVSLFLFLPTENSSLPKFQKILNRENWETWMSGFRQDLVIVVLPRFKVEYEITLNKVLTTLGMGIAFNPGANFRMMSNELLFINWIKHKAFLEVNEAGTEAATSTVVKMSRGVSLRLIFDHPFFFAIRDNVTGTILFMGSVVDPG